MGRTLIAVVVWAASMAAQSHDWTIVPGVRVGPITANTTRADVDRIFGKDAAEDDEIELDEGILRPATQIYKHDPSQRLAIAWAGKGPQARPKQIFVCWARRRGPCRWQTSGGIRVGTRLTELETMNGRPFTVSGFGYNYGGNVLSWEGGSLAMLGCGGRLVLTLDGARSGNGYTVEMTADELHAVRGDRPISSGTPAMRKLNPAVVEMVVQFPGPGATGCEPR